MHTTHPLSPSGRSIVFVNEDGQVNIQKVRTINGGVNEIDLTPDEARLLLAALSEALDAPPIDFTPRPKAGA